MLEELHAGHDVELAGPALRVFLGGDALVADLRLALQRMQLSDAQRERVSVLGRIFFQQNQDRLAALSSDLAADPAREINFLDRLENSDQNRQ